MIELDIIYYPKEWSKFMRRAFMLLLPISVPLWITGMSVTFLSFAVVVILLLICVAVVNFAAWITEMWTGDRPKWACDI